jgi:hypothetical protein
MNTKKIFLTKVQKKYMDDNWQNYTYQEMADKLAISLSIISNYYTEKGYRKQSKPEPAPEPPKKIIKPIKKQEGRPRAEYSNISREQHVEKWLNASI